MSAAPTRDPWDWGIGIHTGCTDISMPVVDLAVESEQRGFDSLFLPEHTHIPVSRATPFFGAPEMPDKYRRIYDPLIALSFVAARTDLIVGTCVSLPAEHDPIAHAKAVASLDHLSGGRFVMGVGFGWNREEAADHGFPAKARMAVATEKVALMKELWTKEIGAFEGEHVSVSPSWAWPKPVQQPHPPVLFGGRTSDATFERIASWADGWIPMAMDLAETLPGDLEVLRRAWVDAGRDPDRLYVAVMQAPKPLDELRRDLDLFRSIGVTRVMLDVPSAPTHVVLPLLDRLAPVLEDHAA